MYRAALYFPPFLKTCYNVHDNTEVSKNERYYIIILISGAKDAFIMTKQYQERRIRKYRTILKMKTLWITDLGAVAQLVEALRYKPEGAGSIPDGVIGIFR